MSISQPILSSQNISDITDYINMYRAIFQAPPLVFDENIKLFSQSCVFCDIVDGIANNIILECIKFNTPIIIRRNPSLEEYMGVNYPLFFDDFNQINFKDEINLINLINSAHIHIKNMNKNHVTLESFKNKLDYDISKLKEDTNEYKLSWLFVLENEYSEKYDNPSTTSENITTFMFDTLESTDEN
jgi:hypothetical protein